MLLCMFLFDVVLDLLKFGCSNRCLLMLFDIFSFGDCFEKTLCLLMIPLIIKCKMCFNGIHILLISDANFDCHQIDHWVFVPSVRGQKWLQTWPELSTTWDPKMRGMFQETFHTTTEHTKIYQTYLIHSYPKITKKQGIQTPKKQEVLTLGTSLWSPSPFQNPKLRRLSNGQGQDLREFFIWDHRIMSTIYCILW